MTFLGVKFYNTHAHGTLFLFSASSPIQMRNFKGLLFLEKNATSPAFYRKRNVNRGLLFVWGFL